MNILWDIKSPKIKEKAKGKTRNCVSIFYLKNYIIIFRFILMNLNMPQKNGLNMCNSRNSEKNVDDIQYPISFLCW